MVDANDAAVELDDLQIIKRIELVNLFLSVAFQLAQVLTHTIQICLKRKHKRLHKISKSLIPERFIENGFHTLFSANTSFIPKCSFAKVFDSSVMFVPFNISFPDAPFSK